MSTGEKKLEASGPEERQGSEFPGFSVCFIYLKLAEEAGKLELPTTQTEKPQQQKSLFSPRQKTGKGQPSKTEDF